MKVRISFLSLLTFIFSGSAVLATSGTVTSVGLSLPSIFTVTVSPITTSGTLTAVLNTESANTIFAGPASGAAAIPTFRALVSADIPNNAANTTQDYIQYSKSVNMEILSPDVKEFLRKNRIRLRKKEMAVCFLHVKCISD